jgi:hypothetical protein
MARHGNLLSICETCKRRGITFIDFMLSGETNIEEARKIETYVDYVGLEYPPGMTIKNSGRSGRGERSAAAQAARG